MADRESRVCAALHGGRWFAFAVLLLAVMPVAAEVDGADLLAACGASLRGNASGVEDQMCYWYVTPCDCDYGTEKDLPRACVPASSSEAERARLVVDGLRATPAHQAQSATRAAATILAEHFPCP